ncbi:MAG: BatA domain-containing protein [Planctomycetota bacterium]
MLTFTHAALAFGTLAFLVPLVIHLLNRQRFRRRKWAAMEFLLAAYKKHRRRVRAENLLLLLLRCLIPILLALALARPLLKSAQALVGLGSTAHHILVLDASYSMGVEPAGAASPFAQAKTLASHLLDRVAGKSGHKVSIVVGGVRVTTPVVDDLNIARAKTQLSALAQPHDANGDLLPALRAAAELVETGTDPEYRLYVFTDMQARALGVGTSRQAPPGAEPPVEAPEASPPEGTPPGAAAFADTTRDVLDHIKQRAEVTFFDVGPTGDGGRIDNLQVTDLALRDPLVVAKVPVPVSVGLQNRSEASHIVQVTLEIDGSAPVRQQIEVEAGGEKAAEFPVTFREVGLRTLKASIEADGLEADDARWLVVPARDRVRVLLVEGSDERDEALQEASHLRMTLDPTGGEGPPELTPFQIRTIDTLQFWSGNEPLEAYDLVALCNVESVPPEVAEKLKAAMQAGTSLLILLGSHVKPDAYNAQLYAGGSGPLPLQLGAARGFAPLSREAYNAELVEVDHPVLTDFSKELREVAQQIPVWRFVASEPDSLTKDARVLARLRDPQQSPLLVVSAFGQGKVAVLTTSLSRRPDRWNDLHYPLISFPLLHPLARWLTVPSTNPYNVDVGGVLTAPLEHKPRDVAYLTSERAGAMRVPIGDDPVPLPGGRYGLPPCRDTAYAGVYIADMQVERDGVLTPRQIPFAVNVDPTEGVLEYVAPAVVREKLGVERVLRELPADGSAAIESGRSELGPSLLLMTLIFLVGEAALARFVSTRRG